MILATLFISGVTVAFPAQAEARGTEVSLGEIATVDGADEALVARIAEYDLGYSPAPGFTRLFRRDKLAYSLKNAFPSVSFTFSGQPTCRVHPITETVPASEIESAARAKLLELLDGADSEISPAQSIEGRTIAAGEKPYELRVDWRSGNVRPGRVTVPVQLVVDDVVYGTAWTSWNVDYFVSVPLLLRDVSAGDDVTPDMIRFGRMRASRAPVRDAITTAQLQNAKANRALTAGVILTTRDIARKQLVQRGDTVSLEVKKGGVSARVAAIASRSGYKGDRIPVVVIDTKREITAVIVDRDRVRLDMSTTR